MLSGYDWKYDGCDFWGVSSLWWLIGGLPVKVIQSSMKMMLWCRIFRVVLLFLLLQRRYNVYGSIEHVPRDRELQVDLLGIAYPWPDFVPRDFC